MLIKCAECGKQISDKAVTCPHCGCPVEKKKVCPECGVEVEQNVTECPECGYPFEEEASDDVHANVQTGRLIIRTAPPSVLLSEVTVKINDVQVAEFTDSTEFEIPITEDCEVVFKWRNALTPVSINAKAGEVKEVFVDYGSWNLNLKENVLSSSNDGISEAPVCSVKDIEASQVQKKETRKEHRNTKVCPLCGRETDKNTRTCHGCGYRFTDVKTETGRHKRRKGQRKGNTKKYVVSVALSLIVVVAIVYYNVRTTLENCEPIELKDYVVSKFGEDSEECRQYDSFMSMSLETEADRIRFWDKMQEYCSGIGAKHCQQVYGEWVAQEKAKWQKCETCGKACSYDGVASRKGQVYHDEFTKCANCLVAEAIKAEEDSQRFWEESNRRFWRNAIKSARNKWVDDHPNEARRRGIEKFY